MAQLNNFRNTMSDHPELEELLKSVNLENLFDDKDDENLEQEKEGNK